MAVRHIQRESVTAAASVICMYICDAAGAHNRHAESVNIDIDAVINEMNALLWSIVEAD